MEVREKDGVRMQMPFAQYLARALMRRAARCERRASG